MRNIAIISFYFKFVNEKGNTTSWLSKLGKTDEKGIKLGKSLIFFEDIYKVLRYGNKIVLCLYPFANLSSSLSKQVIKGHYSIVIQTSSFAQELEALIDRAVGKMRLNETKKENKKEGKPSKLLSTQCPKCHTPMDMTNLVDSYYIYCGHCESVFNKYGYTASDGEKYSICPETGYFDRLRNYNEYRIFLLPNEASFQIKGYYASDTLQEMFFHENFKRSFTLLIGAVALIFQRMYALRDRHPDFEELSQANYQASIGEMNEAWNIYHRMIQRLPYHPGFYYNLGLAYLRQKKYKNAVKFFEKSLEGCSNYKPTLTILRKYKSINMEESN